MHVLSRRIVALVLLTALALLTLAGSPAGAINDRGSADPTGTENVNGPPLVPFVGVAEVGCTRGSGGPVCGGHHSYDAIDFLLPNGTPIISPVDGVIVGGDDSCSNTPFTCSGYGNFLHISALDGSASFVLAHLSEVVVTEGTVAAGQLVGFSGESGRASTPHLHFEEHLSTDQELGGARIVPSTMLGCVRPAEGTLYPLDGFDSWYDVPAHAGVEVVNGCSLDPVALGSETELLGGRAPDWLPSVLGLGFDSTSIESAGR